MPRVAVALAATFIAAGSIALGSAWTVSLNGGSHGEAQSQVAPAAPTSPTAVCVSTSTRTVNVAWTAVAHASSYTLSDSTTGSGGTYNTLASGVTTNPYTTSSLSSGTYYFKVTAVIGPSWTSGKSVATSPGRIISISSPQCQ
jgi:hypothetical protein